jgi:hypothetical protein
MREYLFRTEMGFALTRQVVGLAGSWTHVQDLCLLISSAFTPSPSTTSGPAVNSSSYNFPSWNMVELDSLTTIFLRENQLYFATLITIA